VSIWVVVAIAAAIVVWWWLQRRRIVSEGGVATLRSGDADIARAIAKAREDFHFFAARLANPEPGDESFAVKVGIEHEGNSEHLWLTDVRIDGEAIEGEIGNDPSWVPLKLGDRWRGTMAQLSDWVYISHGRMQGNFTLRAMLPRMPKAQREQARALLEERWDTRELVHRPWPRDAPMPGEPLPDDVSTGDSVLMDAVSAHLDAQLGKGAHVFHELVSPSAHIDLYPHPANATRPFHVVATTGAAEKALQLPPGSDADSWIELVLLLPPSWPLDNKSWKDERHYWPFRWLKRVARYHYETGRWLGPGHLLLHGDPPAPIDASTRCDAVLLAPPAALPPAFERVALPDGRSVRLLALYFLTPEERTALEAQGYEEFVRTSSAQRLSVAG